VASKILSAEIPIDVYTPAGYEGSTQRFPVLYLHGGSTARGGLQMAAALDNLIGERMAPVIAVFINRDPPFFGAEDYARMCATELPAFVDEQYRTLRTREGRAHVGWGFGAYGAMYTVLAHPEHAAKVGVQSPFMIDTTPIDPVLKTAAEVPLAVYLDWGKYDMRSQLEFWSVADMSQRLEKHLRERGYEPLGGEAHDGSGVDSWRNRLDEMFEALYPLKAER
jgi:enterochelin esterase-like enzyme